MATAAPVPNEGRDGACIIDGDTPAVLDRSGLSCGVHSNTARNDHPSMPPHETSLHEPLPFAAVLDSAGIATARLLDAALEAAEMGAWRYSFPDHRVYLSPRAQLLYGVDGPCLDRDDATVRRIVHPDDIEAMQEAMRGACNPDGDGRYVVEYRVRRPGGGWRWLSAWGICEFGDDAPLRQPVMMSGASRDITARKHAELFSEAQKRSLEMIVRGAPLGDVLADLTRVVEAQADGEVVASILFLDDEGRLRNGASPSLPAEYVAAIDGLKADPSIGTCSAAASTCRTVVTVDIDNDPAWSALKHLPLNLGLRAAWSQPITDGNGRVLGTFGTYFRSCRGPSASERQAVEILSRTAALAIERARDDQALRDGERRLREADRHKDEFLAALSHELRNPLAPLRTALQLLRTDAAESARGRLLDTMDRQVNQLVRLVDDLLEVSRISRGAVELRNERLDAASVVALAIETSEPVIRAAGHDLSVESPDHPVWINGDRVRLAQILSNLLNNAAKYSNAGGRIVVRTSEHAGEAWISVRDGGVGIDPESMARLFDLFVRGPESDRRHREGLGVGLALARRLAELHGGSLSGASEGPGRGSEFTLRLPVDR